MRNDYKLNGEVLIGIYPLDSFLNVLEKLINIDDFLQHLKLQSERYASQNGRTFAVSLHELFNNQS